MTIEQGVELGYLQKRLGIADGTVWALAQEIAHNKALKSLYCLTSAECSELIRTMMAIEGGALVGV